ncbi:hypothetical protein ACS8Y6_17430 [Salinisphaera sp. RV14]|uniref:hypothetical protein n=1 Tax=unclassified Salinisphaera TaxID=2649847 RepID=UPI003F8462F6
MREPALDDQFLSTKEFATELGVSDQTMRNRLRDGLIYGRRSDRGHTFPRSRLVAAKRRDQPARIVPGSTPSCGRSAIPTRAWAWLTTPNTALADTTGARRAPIQELQTGSVEKVQALLLHKAETIIV